MAPSNLGKSTATRGPKWAGTRCRMSMVVKGKLSLLDTLELIVCKERNAPCVHEASLMKVCTPSTDRSISLDLRSDSFPMLRIREDFERRSIPMSQVSFSETLSVISVAFFETFVASNGTSFTNPLLPGMPARAALAL